MAVARPLVTVALPSAHLDASADGRLWWHCPECRKKMAEVAGRRVIVIRRDFRGSYDAAPTLPLMCANCGAISAMGEPSANLDDTTEPAQDNRA